MLQYFIKRLLALIPKLLLITLIIFFALEALPGDIVTRSIDPELLSTLTEAQIDALREAKGLNDPAYIRYFRWLGGLFRGEFGYSLGTGASIRSLLASRLPATMEIVVLGLIISTVLGILFGFLSAIKQNSAWDYASGVMGMLGISIPEFFFGMLFILVFAIQLKWFPTGGRFDLNSPGFWGHLKHIIMPAVSVGISLVATLMRYTRNSMLDVMNKDYIKTARSKGLRESVVYTKHCFRNGCAPVMILLISRLGFLISGTTATEIVFNYPGMGSLMLSAITVQDTPVAMMILLLTSTSVLICCFVADIVLAFLDPRVRFGEE